MDTLARYEVMRNARDRRYGLWAVLLSMLPRQTGATADELKARACAALESLAEEGFIYLFRMPARWGDERPLEMREFADAFRDERNWRPRMSNPRELVRVGTTPDGDQAFREGAFGDAPPMLPTWAHLLAASASERDGPDLSPRDQFGEPRY